MTASPFAWSGLRIIVSDRALLETQERLFPESRHRSRRLHKKLVRRHGGEFRKVPAAWETPTGLVMHPQLYAALRAKMEEATNGR